MSDKETARIGMYYIVMGTDSAMIIRIDLENGDQLLCLTFSRVGGNSFLRQCITDGIFTKVDFESFENYWEFYNFPDFHSEEETVIDGHAAELLCVYLGVFVDLVNEGYDFKEIFNLFKAERSPQYNIPIAFDGCEKNYGKDISALVVGGEAGVKYFFDKSDALSLMDLSEDKTYKKRTRKAVLHSALPYRSIEPARTYTGLAGELIAYLFWIDSEFG